MNPKVIEILNNLLKENIATNLMVKRIMVKVEGIETNLAANEKNNQTPSIYLDSQFLSSFPINHINKFHEIEN